MPLPKVEVYATLPITITVAKDGVLSSVATLPRTLHFRLHLTEAALASDERFERAISAEMGAMRHDIAALIKGNYQHDDAGRDNDWWPEVVALVRRMVRSA